MLRNPHLRFFCSSRNLDNSDLLIGCKNAQTAVMQVDEKLVSLTPSVAIGSF
jgi:hypothetical protein